jgi:hypothetical protein
MSDKPVSNEAPALSAQHVAILAASARMQLSEAHLAELVDAYGYIQRMLARIHGNFHHSVEPAHVFAPAIFVRSKETRA